MNSFGQGPFYGQQPNNFGRRPYQNTGSQDDINIALTVLIAAVMKADGDVRKSELDYVKNFLLRNYGEDRGKELLHVLRDLTKSDTNIDIPGVCTQIKYNTNYDTRYHMVDFLFGLATADGEFHVSENNVLRSIANGLGINRTDFASIYSRHVNQSYNSYQSYSGGSSNSYSSRSSSPSHTDPYAVLGISPTASDDEVKKAYRRLAMKYHPDKVEGMGEEVKKQSAEQFRKINEAYEQIKAIRGIK